MAGERRVLDGKGSHSSLRLAIPSALVVAAVSLVLYAWRANDRAAAATLQHATDRLATCLFDDPTRILLAGSHGVVEAAAVRATEVFRTEELATMGLSPERRLASPDAAWPARCSVYGHALASLEQRSGSHARAQATFDLTIAFEGSDGSRSLGGALAPRFAAWLDGLHASGRTMGRVDDVLAAPRPVHADTLDTLDRKALLVAGSAGLAAFDHLRFGAFASEKTSWVVDDERRAGGQAVCGYEKGRARCGPLVGSVADALATPPPASSPPTIPGVEPKAPVEWCSSRAVVIARQHGWDIEYLSFLKDAVWSAPVVLDAPGGGGAMTCVDARVTLLEQRGHLEGGRYEPVIREIQCAPEGCVTRAVQTRELFANNESVIPTVAGDLAVASVGERVLLLWRAGDAGLRMRLAKAPDLIGTDDQVLYDDSLVAGHFRPSTLVTFRAHPVADGALVLLGTTEGTFLYRVDLSGRFTSVPVD